MRKIAVFGSAFNPPTLGHKSIIDSLGHFDKVLLVPSIAHAWKKKMFDYNVRCDLVDVFISDLNLSNVERSQIEEQLPKLGGSVKTYTVLSELSKKNSQADITFVLGPDNLLNFEKFYKSEEILQCWSVLVCPEKVAIRSTEIRQRIADGSDIGCLTTPSVSSLLRKLSIEQLFTI
ncbi:nicotinate-nucleotide adenylyltransferase [Candidatus Photodesmus blepharus]|uniref:nicotinate-nucleotide adenylyltransferase n=1 Tax=Candidatus Photodesmus blepharonis TaxID=1179155 RepID=A0A084CMK7_9GAMM|nr:nicotinate-nicotinamide nucleotide adenylyltransferase [Candidatus Photodesmus blepharus]KEY91036.1 nicotinate-nucleotide adenylyltransferase [Candidatus Photodesmus blepharus]